MSVNLQELLAGELAADLRADGRAHSRYLQVLDRVYLSEYTTPGDDLGGKVAGLNAASHAPGPQPWTKPA